MERYVGAFYLEMLKLQLFGMDLTCVLCVKASYVTRTGNIKGIFPGQKQPINIVFTAIN